MLSYARDRLTSHLCTRRTGATRGAFVPASCAVGLELPSPPQRRPLLPSFRTRRARCRRADRLARCPRGPGCAFRAPDRSQARWPWLRVSASPKSRIRLFSRPAKRMIGIPRNSYSYKRNIASYKLQHPCLISSPQRSSIGRAKREGAEADEQRSASGKCERQCSLLGSDCGWRCQSRNEAPRP